ncbi:Phosphonate monoester hydrolase, partial [hydrothermal vent metagenome]
MNILFITADQWRGECLSALGHAHVKTPNLDALAADGALFRRHYAQATPCGPSRACLYTGMYMQNHRSLLNGTPMDARHTNVALEARKAGYAPALFGYTDVSLDPRHQAPGTRSARGFDGVLPGMDPVGFLSSDWGPWLAELRKKGYQLPEEAARIYEPDPAATGSGDKGKTYLPARFRAKDSSAA